MILRSRSASRRVEGQFDVMPPSRVAVCRVRPGAVKHGISKALQLYEPACAAR
jgi:small subunit ribosomal protein S9